jgi:hypothetical protein
MLKKKVPYLFTTSLIYERKERENGETNKRVLDFRRFSLADRIMTGRSTFCT